MFQANNGGGLWLTRTGFDPLKAFLSFMLACLGVSAATPSFSSFNANQFATNNLFISIKDGAVITNLNAITDLFINGTNIVTLFAPSSSSYNLNTNQFTTSGGITSFSDQVYAGAYSSKYGMTLTNILRQNLDAGTNDIFTIPAGYFTVGSNTKMSTTNTSASAVVKYTVTNGVYYAELGSITITTNSYANIDTTFSANFPYMEGETVSIVTTTKGAAANTFFYLVPTNQTFKISKLHSLSAGYNTLLTVATNKTGISVLNTFAGSGNGPIFAYLNNSGGPRVVSFHVVQAGDSPSDATRIQQHTVNNGISVNVFLMAVSGGSSLVMETDASTDTQMAYTILLEVP